MQKLKLFIYCLSLVAISAACKSYSKTNVTTKVVGPTVIQKPVIADLEVKEERVAGTATDKGSTPTIEVKQAALNDALKKANADVLVEPRYEVISSFRTTTVNVTGYPATYKNFRPMIIEDTMFVERSELKTKASRPVIQRKNGRRNKIIGYSLGGVGAAVGIFFLTILFL